MKKNKPWEQLAKYFAGELSELEYRKMDKWIKAAPNRTITFRKKSNQNFQQRIKSNINCISSSI